MIAMTMPTWLTWVDSLAWPWVLWALPLPILMHWWPSRPGAGAALRVPYAADQLQSLGAASGGAGPRLGRALLWLAWACLCVAAARPQQLGEAVTPPQQGRQMMLAVDVSGSMSEADMMLGNQVVERLTAAKAVLADFLDRRVGDRVGLLIFGERAYTLTPLTADLTSVRDQLRDSVVGLAGRETAIGDAIALAVKRLREQPEGQRVLILLTDGNDTGSAITPAHAARLAKAQGIVVHTIGIGDPEASGQAKVDLDLLQDIARQTGGRFFRADDRNALQQVYATLDSITPHQVKTLRHQPKRDLFYWPLGAALALLVVSHGLAAGFAGRSLARGG